MNATARHTRPKRRGMKVLAALLSAVCAIELMIAFDRIPMQAWPLSDWPVPDFSTPRWSAPTWSAPSWVMPDWLRLPRLDADVARLAGNRLTTMGERAREIAWPSPVIVAVEADMPLHGAYVAAEGAGEIAFDGALMRWGGRDWRTEPLRIVPGQSEFAEGRTFAHRLRAAPDAQIELRRIVPNDAADEAEVAPTPSCGGEAPGVLALLHRGDRIDLMLFRAGVVPGPAAEASGLCGVWTFSRP